MDKKEKPIREPVKSTIFYLRILVKSIQYASKNFITLLSKNDSNRPKKNQSSRNQ